MGIFQTVSTGFFNVCSTLARSVTRITEFLTFIVHLNYTVVTYVYTSACYVLNLIFTTLNYIIQAVSTVGLHVFDFLCEIYACVCALLVLWWRICILIYKVFCLIFAGLETLGLCVWNGGVFTYKTLQQSATDVMETCESTTDYIAMLAQDFVVYVCDTLTTVGNFSTWVIRGLWVGIGYVPYTASCIPGYLSQRLTHLWYRLSTWVSFVFMGVTQETYIGIAICCLVYMLLSRLVHRVYCRGFFNLFSFRRRRQSGARRANSIIPVPFDRDFESDLEDDDLDNSSHEASDDDNDNNDNNDDAGEESDTHTELTLSDGEESDDGDDAGSESDVSLNSQTFSSEDSDHDIDVQLPASSGDSAQHSRCSTPSRNIPKDMNPDEFERELERERDKRKCVVCQDWNKSVLVLPCKHMCLCVRCANHIVRSPAPARRLCPLCRSRIERVMDVYV